LQRRAIGRAERRERRRRRPLQLCLQRGGGEFERRARGRAIRIGALAKVQGQPRLGWPLEAGKRIETSCEGRRQRRGEEGRELRRARRVRREIEVAGRRATIEAALALDANLADAPDPQVTQRQRLR
jgi:hypothetical protein